MNEEPGLGPNQGPRQKTPDAGITEQQGIAHVRDRFTLSADDRRPAAHDHSRHRRGEQQVDGQPLGAQDSASPLSVFTPAPGHSPMSSSHYDVIIIGTGAGGGTLAHRLAPSGKRILLLERGDYVPREQDNWSTRAVNVEGKYQTKEHWRDKDGKELHPHTNYCVGGNTKFYGAALFRLRREDFGELRHHGGVSPAWPIGYDELEPYYTEAEHLYQVHGERGVDPTEPPASAPYRLPGRQPRAAHPAAERRLRRGSACTRFTCRSASCSTRRTRAQSRCIRCGTCDGHPCLVRPSPTRRWSASTRRSSIRTSTLLTNAYVARLETSASGREVTRVLVERDGAARDATRPTSSWSPCGAINSAALLLRSASDQHPRGLANGSDVVGRHYMGHVNSVLMALSKCPNPTVFQKTLAVNDFYFGSPEWEYPDGPHLLRRQAGRRHALGGRAGDRPGLDAGPDGQALARLLAHVGGPARPGQPGDARPRRARSC